MDSGYQYRIHPVMDAGVSAEVYSGFSEIGNKIAEDGIRDGILVCESYPGITEDSIIEGLSFLSAELGMFPQSKITLPEDKLETFRKMLDKLEENDDVQTVWHNVELPEEDEE